MASNDFYVMLHDEKRCIGCQACTVACKVLNDTPEMFNRVQVRILGSEESEAGVPFRFFRVSCQHCDDAPCIACCSTGASFRDPNGIVRIDAEKCVGCGCCVGACPYHIRYIDPRTHVADKCDFCAKTRLPKGLLPACVNACPTNALIFGRSSDEKILLWEQEKQPYMHQLDGVGKPHLYRSKETRTEGK